MDIVTLDMHIAGGTKSSTTSYRCPQCGSIRAEQRSLLVEITKAEKEVVLSNPVPPIVNEGQLYAIAVRPTPDIPVNIPFGTPVMQTPQVKDEPKECQVCHQQLELKKIQLISGCCGKPLMHKALWVCPVCHNKLRTTKFASEEGREIINRINNALPVTLQGQIKVIE